MVHFRLASGVEGTMSSSASAWGPPLMVTRVVGTKGTAWLQGDAVVWTGTSGGTRWLRCPTNPAINSPRTRLRLT